MKRIVREGALVPRRPLVKQAQGACGVAAASAQPRLRRDALGEDGAPLPPDFDASKSNTLGLKIIDNLTRGTLRGKFTMVSHDGQTIATLSFPRPS